VTGPEAESWLNWIMAGRMPKDGKVALTPMLSPKGRIIGDFTITRLAEDRFQLTASFGAQDYHMRWFLKHMPKEGVAITNVSTRLIGFQIAGPKSRELLARVAKGDVSTAALPFMAAREMDVGLCRALVQRVSYTGDLGYEIYVPAEDQLSLYETLTAAGAELGLKPFGMRAMMSLRLEKAFGSWLREFKPDYTPLETGLDRFVAYNKVADFIGKAAALKEKAEGVKRRLSTFVVDAKDADVWGDEPIWLDGKVQGFVSSGGYAHHARKSVALGFLPVETIRDGLKVEIEILGEKRPAVLVSEALFDPKAERLRG
jgi:dimethylglycine dehydrogenase